MLLSNIWSFVWLVSLCVLGKNSNPRKCDDAQTSCQYYTKCAFKLAWMFRKCKKSLGYDARYNRIIGSLADSCSLDCVYAIGNLTSIERGKNLETCECGTDAMCLTVKSRMKKCVEMASGRYNITTRGCTEARKTCSNDANCREMQDAFLLKCTDMISGVNCTDNCKESRDKFLSSELGKAMTECECDGFEEPHCRGIRAHHEALCVKDPRRSITRQPTRNSATRKAVRMSSDQNKMTSFAIVYASTIMATIANFYR